jgi:glucoamylase
MRSLENYANECGLFPEQVWDSEDIPQMGLFFGKPSGSAMPLAWAHAEYIKLCRSLNAKRIFDMPSQVEQRYLIEKKTSNIFIWGFESKYRHIPKGKTLRVQCLAPSSVRWSIDNWQTYEEVETLDSGLGLYYADLATASLESGQKITYTFYWPECDKWEDCSYTLSVEKDKSEIAEEKPAHETPDRDRLKVFFPS